MRSAKDNSAAPTAVVLGPQRLAPTLGEACDALGVAADRRVAVITAGWQEREPEHDELFTALGRPAVNLRLHARAEAVFAAEPELFAAHRDKQDKLKQLQRLYRRRLRHAMDAVRELEDVREHHAGQTPAALIERERDAAIADVRRLDREHEARLVAVERAYEEAERPSKNQTVLRQREELLRLLGSCDAVAIAGGHVATLLERIRLFDIGSAIATLPILCWSAGAMVLCDRIVLFHDRPPQGRGDAEVMHAGLGLLPGLVPLPHARHRLITRDRDRVSRFARRFAPATCVALDERCAVHMHGPARERFELAANTHQLREDGSCQ